MRGRGLSLLGTAVVRLVTKAAFTDSANSLRLSACVFYVASALFCWICLFIHRQIIVPHPVWQDDTNTDERQSLLQERSRDDGVPQSLWSRIVESPWMKTGMKIRLAIYCMFLTTFSQLVVFPGILTDIEVRQACNPAQKSTLSLHCLCSMRHWAAIMKSCWCYSIP